MSTHFEKMKVTTILGTRPEIIRLSEIVKKFENTFQHRLVFSSQNREAFVGSDFFSELGLRNPDVVLENKTKTTAEFLSSLFVFVEEELLENRPDAVVILGDTNTSLASIIARKLGIPVYHLEAGNRSFDLNVPEEINRKIVDHTSDFNLAYTNHALRNLVREGLHPRNCVVVGTPLREVIESNRDEILKSLVLNELEIKVNEYFLVSAHRQENIDSPARLRELSETLNHLAEVFSLPIIVSTHPRLQSKIETANYVHHPLIRFITPRGFHDYCKLQMNAMVVLSDSGSVSEECAILNFKALTLRDSMERPEALESGTIQMTGLSHRQVIPAVHLLSQSKKDTAIPVDYAIVNTSERVVNFILSTQHVRDFWAGIRTSDENRRNV